MILGKPTKLSSQFHLTWNMILNLMRVQTFKVEDIIKRSFSENITQKALPEQQKDLEEKSQVLKSMKALECTICQKDIYEYHDVSSRILSLGYELNEKIVSSVLGAKVLIPGRVVIINNSFFRNGLGIILNSFAVSCSNRVKTFSVFVLTSQLLLDQFADVTPLPITRLSIPSLKELSYKIITVPFTDITMISNELFKMDENRSDSNDFMPLANELYHLSRSLLGIISHSL